MAETIEAGNELNGRVAEALGWRAWEDKRHNWVVEPPAERSAGALRDGLLGGTVGCRYRLNEECERVEVPWWWYGNAPDYSFDANSAVEAASLFGLFNRSGEGPCHYCDLSMNTDGLYAIFVDGDCPGEAEEVASAETIPMAICLAIIKLAEKR